MILFRQKRGLPGLVHVWCSSYYTHVRETERFLFCSDYVLFSHISTNILFTCSTFSLCTRAAYYRTLFFLFCAVFGFFLLFDCNRMSFLCPTLLRRGGAREKNILKYLFYIYFLNVLAAAVAQQSVVNINKLHLPFGLSYCALTVHCCMLFSSSTCENRFFVCSYNGEKIMHLNIREGNCGMILVLFGRYHFGLCFFLSFSSRMRQDAAIMAKNRNVQTWRVERT